MPQPSVPGFLEFLFYLIIAGFFVRWLTTTYHDRPIAKALAFIY